MENEDFFTFSEYMKREYDELTASMEDYLEMIFRLSQETGFTRIHDIAEALNVQPPSVTKMVKKLSELKLIKYERYSIIMLTEEGKKGGCSLLKRHNIIEGFLKIIGVRKELLKETETIEHTISGSTLMHLEDFIEFVGGREDFIIELYKFKAKKRNEPDEDNIRL